MNLAKQYAQALFETEPPAAKVYAVLQKRGHEKLLPQIVSEMEKLELTKNRSEAYKKVTPEMRQTKTLLELYGKLVASGETLNPHD